MGFYAESVKGLLDAELVDILDSFFFKSILEIHFHCAFHVGVLLFVQNESILFVDLSCSS